MPQTIRKAQQRVQAGGREQSAGRELELDTDHNQGHGDFKQGQQGHYWSFSGLGMGSSWGNTPITPALQRLRQEDSE